MNKIQLSTSSSVHSKYITFIAIITAIFACYLQFFVEAEEVEVPVIKIEKVYEEVLKDTTIYKPIFIEKVVTRVVYDTVEKTVYRTPAFVASHDTSLYDVSVKTDFNFPSMTFDYRAEKLPLITESKIVYINTETTVKAEEEINFWEYFLDLIWFFAGYLIGGSK